MTSGVPPIGPTVTQSSSPWFFHSFNNSFTLDRRPHPLDLPLLSTPQGSLGGEGDRVLRSTRSPTQTTRLTFEWISWISCELLLFIPSNIVNIYYNIMFVIYCHIMRLGNGYLAQFEVAKRSGNACMKIGYCAIADLAKIG